MKKGVFTMAKDGKRVKNSAWIGGSSNTDSLWLNFFEGVWGNYFRRMKLLGEDIRYSGVTVHGEGIDEIYGVTESRLNYTDLIFHAKNSDEVVERVRERSERLKPKEQYVKLFTMEGAIKQRNDALVRVEKEAAKLLQKREEHSNKSFKTVISSGKAAEVNTLLLGDPGVTVTPKDIEACKGQYWDTIRPAYITSFLYEAVSEYHKCEEAVYTVIEKALREKRAVTASVLRCGDESELVAVTRGCKKITNSVATDESKVNGLAYPHAYAISDVLDDPLGNKWILVSNPWNHFGRRYCIATDVIRQRLASKKGTFWVELRDFVADFDSFNLSPLPNPMPLHYWKDYSNLLPFHTKGPSVKNCVEIEEKEKKKKLSSSKAATKV